MTYKKPSETFRDISIVKPLNKAKFPVYLVNTQLSDQYYAMKVFPFAAAKPHVYFQNEARFSFVNHPNVIRTHHIEPERETITQAGSKMVSYTVMEFAPYGDLFDMMMNHGTTIDDKLIRTYFKQLIEGLEYLHDNGVAHMDLKLENILIGEDYNLKIADFDLSYLSGDNKILSKGTKFYRSPELIQGRCFDTTTADIYSAGIILFTLKTRGMLPHAEDSQVSGIDFAGLLYTQNDQFWNKHCEIQNKDETFFEDDFKALFNALVSLNPENRPTIAQIKQSKWYNGPSYTPEEVKTQVGKLFNL
jgi:serine/threonine protein kinase